MHPHQRERARLKAALDRHQWNVTATARALNVSRGWLRRRIEWFEL
jgi:transcriptional regulator of acetoin/glycerol metabolism